MDADSAALARKAGANSQRAKLSEQHLATWGDDIEVNDMKAYEAMGMSNLVAFLGGLTAEHSTAPPGKASWELEFYSPRNLYEPIFLPDGELNYSDVQSKDEVQITPTGVAYATLGKLLDGALSDPAATQDLALPANTAGGAFRTKGGKKAFVLWARDGATEDAKAGYKLPSDQPVTLYRWDHSATGASEVRPPEGGAISLELESSPLLVIAE